MPKMTIAVLKTKKHIFFLFCKNTQKAAVSDQNLKSTRLIAKAAMPLTRP